MEAVKMFKALKNNSRQIKELLNERFPLWESKKKTYDKIGYGFNLDRRFSSCLSVEITFDSWMGVYGSSDCSNQLRLDSDTFKKHFIKYLNTNKTKIMLSIADSIDVEADSLKDKAREELEAQIESLNELNTL